MSHDTISLTNTPDIWLKFVQLQNEVHEWEEDTLTELVLPNLTLPEWYGNM